jgi:hypothetical protein
MSTTTRTPVIDKGFARGKKKRPGDEDRKEQSSDIGGRQSTGGPPSPADWQEGRDTLVQFLEDLKTILAHVVRDRIVIDPSRLTDPDPLYEANLTDAKSAIDEVIKNLNEDKTGERWYWPLKKVGMAGKAFWLKMRDMYDAVSTKSIGVVLEITDTIGDSLSTVFPVLEPVLELKEMAESRVKYSGDKPLLTTLNLSGREQIDYDSKVSEE